MAHTGSTRPTRLRTLRSRGRYEYVWRPRENTARRSSAIKAWSIVLPAWRARTDDGQTSTLLCLLLPELRVRTVTPPARLITEPEPEPHGSIASCRCAGPRDGPCDREWFLNRKGRSPGKAGLDTPGPAIGPGADSRVPRSGDDCRKSHLTTFPLGSSERVQYRCRC